MTFKRKWPDEVVVSQLIARLWLNELGRQLGGGRLLPRVLVALCLLALSSWQAIAVARQLLVRDIPPVPHDLQVELGSEFLIAGVIVPALILVVLLVLAPARSAIESTLAVLPLAPRARRIGTDAPLVAIAVVASGLLLAPIAASSAALLDKRIASIFIALTGIALVTGVLVTWLISRSAFWFLAGRLQLPISVARTLAALPIMGGAIWVLAASLGVPWMEPSLRPERGVVTGCWGVGIAAAAAVLIRFVPHVEPRQTGALTLGWIAPSRRSRSTRGRTLELEVIRWYRSPLVIMVDGFALVAALALALILPAGSEAWVLLTPALTVASVSGSAVVAFGVTRASDWTWSANSSSPLARVGTKIVGIALMNVVQYVACSVILVVSGKTEPEALLALAPYAMLAFAVGLLVGIALPVDEGVGLSSIATVSCALALDVGVGAALGALDLGKWAFLAAVATSVAFIGTAAVMLTRKSPRA